MYTRDDIERVRDATDLVGLVNDHVALKPRGREHVGLCPFHDDSRPSFAVVTHKQTAFYKCHACGASGDCFTFIQEHLGKDFSEAVSFLADRAGIELTAQNDDEADTRRARRVWLRTALDAAQDRFVTVLDDEHLGSDARAMITQRGISKEMVSAFGIGCAAQGWSDLLDSTTRDDLPGKVLVAAGLAKERDNGGFYDAFRNRLMFPIMDDSGHPIAFGGRVLSDDDEPKYLNSCEHDLFQKSRTLYGMHLARRDITRTGVAIVAEGYTDVIACHQAGFANVVATLGTALTNDHARTLSRLCDVVVLLFDGDEAGMRAADRAIVTMASHPVDVHICVLPDGLDPDGLLAAGDGPDRFKVALDSAVDAMAYLLSRFARDLDGATSIAGTQRHLETFIATIARAGLDRAEPLRRALLTSRLAELTGVTQAVIDDLLRQSATDRKDSQDVESEELPGMDHSHTMMPTALRRAEHEWLAVAIYGLESLPESVPDFEDHDAAAIGAALMDLSGARESASVQALLERLDEGPVRDLASNLYFEGRTRVEACGDDVQAAFESCFEALQQCRTRCESRVRIEEFKTTSADDPNAAAAAIDQLRKAGPRPAAMPRPAGH